MDMIIKESSQENTQKISTDEDQIHEIVSRGVEDVFILEDVRKKLLSGKKLRIKLGFDPTSPHVHIGRAVVLWKLRAFQDLGHTAVFIVGDFTAQIGDPSDKLEKRPMLSSEKIKENLKTYKEQIGKIIDLSQAEFHYNSTWLSKLGFQEIAELAESFSVQQMSTRRNFKDRFDRGEEVSLREFLYPLMQGYDSVAVEADVELGGFDQLFNVKAGRIIQKHYHKAEQDVLTVQMLEGTDGRKMSSSWGNVISLIDSPADMYGKVMAIRDELIGKYFLLCTRLSLDEIAHIKNDLAVGKNPRDLKARLAREIVTLYHGATAAEEAEQNFTNTFKKGELPDDVKEVSVPQSSLLIDILIKEGLIESKTDFRRLIKDGAIAEIGNDIVIDDANYCIKSDVALRIGKKRFIQIKIEK